MEKNDQAEAYRKALTYALRRLTAKSQLTAELRQAVLDKGHPSEIVEQVIAFCLQQGYLNDDAWLQQFIRYQIARKLSPQAIYQKLALKGVSRSKVKPWMEQLHPQESQQSVIEHLLATRYRTRDLSDRAEYQKVIAALYRKGFDLTLIKQALLARTKE